MKIKMDLNSIRFACLLATAVTFSLAGCGGKQIGHILKPGDQNLVGSHAAGAATFDPLVDDSVGKLLGAAESNEAAQAQGSQIFPPVNICFVGIENKSAEELGDFKYQLTEQIDTMINNHHMFSSISRNYVDEGLRLTRLRPSQLVVPSNMREFSATLERDGQVFDYLLYATLTSGTTMDNANKQRDYLLTLSLVDVATGQQVKQSAEIRKGYHKSRFAKWNSFNPFKKQNR